MGAREELHHLVDNLSMDEIGDALDYIQWLASDHDSLTDEELDAVRAGEEQIEQGKFVRLSDLRRRLA